MLQEHDDDDDKKGPFCIGIKVHNNLTPEIKDLSHNIRKFK